MKHRRLLIAVCVKLLFVIVALPNYCSAARSVPKKVLHLKVDRPRVQELQRAVDQGHQPWRTDPEPVAAVALMHVAPELNLHDAYEIGFKTISSSRSRMLLEYGSPVLKRSYRVKLRKFRWLLPLVTSWDGMVWTATEVAVTDRSP